MNTLFIKARSRLLLAQPFFGTLCLYLKPVESEKFDTGATDGIHLYYNPKWFEKLNEAERVGFLAHEVMHVVLMHHTRRQERHPEKWNVAADYAINLILLKNNFILPKGGLIDNQYADMTTEAIYAKLPTPPEGLDGFAIMLDNKGSGGVIDHPGAGSSKTKGAIEAQLTVAINQAAEQAKAAGKLPGHMEEILEQVTQAKVCWKQVLARFLQSNNNSDYSWLMPNRRFIHSGLYLPTARVPAIGEIAFIQDTSGSRTTEELNQDLSEASAILQDANPEKVHFIQCDTEVNDVKEYTREDLPLRCTATGRGGTMFSPAIKYVKKHLPNIAAIIYMTDLECDDFGEPPSCPVLWITTQKGEAPYGEIIEM